MGPAPSDLVRLDDVRVIEASGETRLVHEHVPELKVFGQLEAELLDHFKLVEAGRPACEREIDRPHPAPAELEDKSVAGLDPGMLPAPWTQVIKGYGKWGSDLSRLWDCG
jgi:hypothetical protein